MDKMMKQVFSAVYLIIFFHFTRRTLAKIVEEMDDIIPMVKMDDEDWYAIRLYRKYVIYSDLHRSEARQLAKAIYDAVPALRGNIEILRIYEIPETPLDDIPGLTEVVQEIIIKAHEACEEE